MASQVEITRLALSHIADAARVNSIDPPDNTVQAQHAATFFPIALDDILEAYDWPFATRRWVLEESLVTFPDGEWAFAYTIPSDFIRAIKVVPPGASRDHPGEPFKLESDSTELDVILLCNVDEAVLHYVYREEETGRYSPGFVTALAYLLGSYLAGPILKGKVGMQVKQALFDQYETQLAIAQGRVANQQAELQTQQQYLGYKPGWITDR